MRASSFIMSWSPKTLHLSRKVPDTQTNENYFYPLWDSILHESFPEDDFAICPQYPVRPATAGREGSIDFAVTYLVQDTSHDDSPVFFVEVKPPTDLRYPSMRAMAAQQIKARFEDLSVTLAIPKLYGISAFGRDVAYFSYDATIMRVDPFVDRNTSEYLRDVAPVTWWDTNVIEDNGRTKFLQIVGEVKNMTRLSFSS